MFDSRFDTDPDRTGSRRPSSLSAGMFPGLLPIPRIRRDWLGEKLRLKPPLDIACREAADRPFSDFNDAMKRLLRFVIHDGRRGMAKILLVSERDKLGATTIAVNFAQMAAKAGHRTLLIEANRRRPVIASLLSPQVRTNLIELNGIRRILCHLHQGFDVMPLLDAQASEILEARAHHCVRGIAGHFDLVVLDGGTFTQNDEMTEMIAAVDHVFCLTPRGLELSGSSIGQSDMCQS